MRSGYFVEWHHLSSRWRGARRGWGARKTVIRRIIVVATFVKPHIYRQIVSTLTCSPLHSWLFLITMCFLSTNQFPSAG